MQRLHRVPAAVLAPLGTIEDGDVSFPVSLGGQEINHQVKSWPVGKAEYGGQAKDDGVEVTRYGRPFCNSRN
jgi:hypothetical protein